MFHQILTPVAGNLLLSMVVAALPIATVLVALGILRRPAWQASLAGLIVGLVIAMLFWQFPVGLAFNSTAAGSVFALWPVMWLVFNALLLYNIAVISGRFDAFRDWVLKHLPNDRRVVLVVIAFCFGCLLEGIAGFGTPVAITTALLMLVGLPALEVLTSSLTDVLSALASLIVTLLFLQVWSPKVEEEFAIKKPVAAAAGATSTMSPWQGWIPWLIVSAGVIIWRRVEIAPPGQQTIHWPGLHNAVFITLYNKAYAANWVFQPLGTGTAILVATIITAAVVGVGPGRYLQAIGITWRQSRLAILTVALIVGLAYLMNYSGMNYTLGLGVASAGIFFPMVSAFLGWVAVFLSGSDTSGNALFGNLQVVAANQLGLNPVLIAATNSSGGVMGKMISPQNIATGVSVTALKGQEGVVFARTFWHSIVLTLLLGLLVLLQQYVLPWMIP